MAKKDKNNQEEENSGTIKPDNNSDQNYEEDDILNKIKATRNLDLSDEDNNTEKDNNEDLEQDDASATDQYEQLKQQLLQEYAEQKQLSSGEAEEENSSKEDLYQQSELPIEEFPYEKEMSTDEELTQQNQVEEINISSTAGSSEMDKNKYDFDDDLEIENVSADPNHSTDNQPKPLNEAQKAMTPDVDQGVSKVAISKGSSLAIMVGLGLFLVFVVYKALQPSPEELALQAKQEVNKKIPISKPVEDVGQTIVVPEIPKLPDAPQLAAPIPPPAPAPPPPPLMDLSPPPAPDIPGMAMGGLEGPGVSPPGLPSLSDDNRSNSGATAAFLADNTAEAEKRKQRYASSMLVGGSGANTSASKNVNPQGQNLNVLARNQNQIVATFIGDLHRVIAQGKIIDAVLETAVNTDLPGMIRAIVSRDVYSEAGKNILIPRGSRLIGSYTSTVKFGANRVEIAWERVIRPDGIDVNVASPGVDSMGRSGVSGMVDNHLLNTFTNAMLISIIDIVVAKFADKQAKKDGSFGQQTQTTIQNLTPAAGAAGTAGAAGAAGGVTTGGAIGAGAPTVVTQGPVSSQTTTAYNNAVKKVGDIGKSFLEKSLQMQPTITIDQGTSIKVFVKKDLVFPGRAANLTRIME